MKDDVQTNYEHDAKIMIDEYWCARKTETWKILTKTKTMIEK